MDKDPLENIDSPAHKRSIRDIPIPAGRNYQSQESSAQSMSHPNAIDLKQVAVKQQTGESVTEEILTDDEIRAVQKKNRRRSGGKKKVVVSLLSVIVVGLVFAVMSAFGKAEVTIYPKKASASVDDLISATPVDEVTEDTEFGYRTIEFSREANSTVEANGEEYVSQKSSGDITVFNSYSESAQKLIKNTRFESPDGLIYRVQESIEVPGYTKNSSGETVPGSLRVTVYADEVGDSYNKNLSSDESIEFKIPGFLGQEQYDYFYAKSETSLTGGFDGVRKIVSEENLESAKVDLKEKLKNDLMNEVNEQLPNNLIAIYSEDSFDYSEINQNDLEGGQVEISMVGNVTVRVVDKYEISEKIAEDNITSYTKGDAILISNLDNLEISFQKVEKEAMGIDGESEIRIEEMISVSGDLSFVWQIDEESLIKGLKGTNRENMKDVLSGFSGIDRAEADISPFWKKSFPEKEGKIIINIEN